MSQHIRDMELEELDFFYELIKKDFPPNEYPPYDSLKAQLTKKVHRALIFSDTSGDLAYAICADNHINEYVLISLFAVFEKYRGKGIGSSFIRKLKEKYTQKKALLVEVEKPELADTLEEMEYRKKRINFYKNLGFYKIPNIDFSIWDVPMHLMALPLQASENIINEQVGEVMYEIYYTLLGKGLIHKMKFQKL